MLSLYLRRSFRRRPMRHFALFWVLMCSFLLPLVVSVYRDSLIYGTYMQTMDFSQGQALHISGAQPEDVEVLRGIDGLTEPYYQDRFIYLNFTDEEAWEYYSAPFNRSGLNDLIQSRLVKNGRSAGSVEITWHTYEAVHGIRDSEFLLSWWRRMLILSLGLSLFSGLIIQSTYRGHIAAFSPELAELAALGATKGQIVRMFLLELAILFLPAAGCAVGISYGVMRVLYRQFFEQTMNADVIWRVFRMDPRNTALQIGFYGLVCLGALGIALLQRSGRKPVKAKKRAATLPRLWVQQTRPPFVRCLLILIPGRQPALADQPRQIEYTPDTQLQAHGCPYAGQPPAGCGQPCQRYTDPPHSSQIEKRGHQCAANALKHAAGHDGRAEQRLSKSLNAQNASAQGDDVRVRRQYCHHLRG